MRTIFVVLLVIVSLSSDSQEDTCKYSKRWVFTVEGAYKFATVPSTAILNYGSLYNDIYYTFQNGFSSGIGLAYNLKKKPHHIVPNIGLLIKYSMIKYYYEIDNPIHDNINNTTVYQHEYSLSPFFGLQNQILLNPKTSMKISVITLMNFTPGYYFYIKKHQQNSIHRDWNWYTYYDIDLNLQLGIFHIRENSSNIGLSLYKPMFSLSEFFNAISRYGFFYNYQRRFDIYYDQIGILFSVEF